MAASGCFYKNAHVRLIAVGVKYLAGFAMYDQITLIVMNLYAITHIHLIACGNNTPYEL